MSYGRTLKGDRIIPTNDFKDRNIDTPITNIPPLLNPKRLSRKPTSIPVHQQKKRYSKVPEPTSLEFNKRAMSHTIVSSKPSEGNKLSKLAKRVSSLQESIFQQKRDITPSKNQVKIPGITQNDLSTNVPFIEKFNHEQIHFQSPNIIKRLTNKFKPSSPLSEFQESIAASILLSENNVISNYDFDTYGDDDEDEGLIDMDQTVFVNDDHISVNLDSSATSILSSVLNRYSNLSQEEIQIKINHSNNMEPIHIKLPSLSNTPTQSYKSNSIFSENQTTTPSSKLSTKNEDVYDFDDILPPLTHNKLPMEIYNIKLAKSPIDQFKIRDYTNNNEKSIIIDHSLPPPTPKHEYNVSPSTTYYTCQSSSSSSIYSSTIPIDYTNLKIHSEQIKIPNDTEIFTRKPHMRTSSNLTTQSKEYLKFANIDPFMLNGFQPIDDVDADNVKLMVVNP